MNSRSDGFRELALASQNGRPIVPFLAAGFSAGTGYPLVEQLTTYLLKVKFYIKHGVHKRLLGPSLSTPAATSPMATNTLSPYLRAFGWPDPNQLTVDLYNSFTATLGTVADGATDETHTWSDSVIKDFLSRHPKNVSHKLSQRFDDFRARTTPRRWGAGRWRIATAIQTILLQDLVSRNADAAGKLLEDILAFKIQPSADWSRLLMELSEGHLGLVDALFSRFGDRYAPGRSHTIMADLVRTLGISLILTTNFDPFLELSLAKEGLRPRVFDVGRDALPPDESVIRQGLSIVKLHGGAFGFRVGERLDYALDDTTRSVVERYIPSDALLLVIGFSGQERRMMQLLEHLTSPSATSLARHRPRILWTYLKTTGTSDTTSTPYLSLAPPDFIRHPISDAADFLLEWYQRTTGTYPKTSVRYPALPRLIVPVDSPTDTRDDRLRADTPLVGGPATASSVDSLSIVASSAPQGTPLKHNGALDADRSSRHSAASSQPQVARCAEHTARTREAPFHIFVRDTLAPDTSTTSTLSRSVGTSVDAAPSLAMADFMLMQRGYSVIWIDLEDHHTVSGVVTEIADKLRVFDPDLPTLVLPIDAPLRELTEPLDKVSADTHAAFSQHVDKPIRYITRALYRGRYFVAFDSLQGFGRLHTSHHGLPSTAVADTSARSAHAHPTTPYQRHATVKARMYEMFCFLERLLTLPEVTTVSERERTDIDWLCCVSCDEPTMRHWKSLDGSDGLVQEYRALLVNGLLRSKAWQPCNGSGGNEEHATHIVHIHSPLQPHSPGHSPRPPQSSSALNDLVALLNQLPYTSTSTTDNVREAGTEPDRTDYIFNQATLCVRRIVAQCFPDAKHPRATPRLFASTLDAAFLLLTVFRRPRSYAAIHAVWNEFQFGSNVPSPIGQRQRPPRARRDSALKALGAAPFGVLRPMMGGFYWIPHHLHEWTYKALSDTVHWKSLWSLPDEKAIDGYTDNETADVLYSLGFLTLVHSRTAFFYYVHAFARSRDVKAFFEYLYHRTSALRYAKTLSSLLCALEGMNPDAFPNAIASAATVVNTIAGHEGVDALGGTHSDLGSMRGLVDHVRTKLLQGFINAIERERDFVFSSASADTWIAWLERLERDCEHIVAGSTKTGTPFETQLPTDDFRERDVALVAGGMNLHLLLLDSRAQLLRERRAWQECLECRLKTGVHLIARVARLPSQIVGSVRRPQCTSEADVSDKVSSLSTVICGPHAADGVSTTSGYGVAGRAGRRPSRAMRTLASSEVFVSADVAVAAMGTPTITCQLECATAGCGEVEVKGDCGLGAQCETTESPRCKFSWNQAFTELSGAVEDALLNGFGHASLERLWNVLRNSVLKNDEGDVATSAQITTLFESASGRAPWLRLLRDTVIDVAICARHLCGQGEDESAKLGKEILEGLGGALLAGIKELVAAHAYATEAIGQYSLDAIIAALQLDFDIQALQFDIEAHSLWDKCVTDCFGAEVDDRRRAGLVRLHAQVERACQKIRGVTPTGLREFFRRTCRLRTLAARCLCMLERCDEAYSALDEAEGGIRPTTIADRAMLVNVHCTKAEVLMKHADVHVRRRGADGNVAHVQFSAARMRLNTARTSLDSAEALLRESRRSVEQWRTFYRCSAQREIEELLLLLVEIEWIRKTRGSDEQFVTELWSRVRGGLEAVSGGWDCSAPTRRGSVFGKAGEYQWSGESWIAMWIQLMVGSYMCLSDYALLNRKCNSKARSRESCLVEERRLESDREEFSSIGEFMTRWRLANEAAGLRGFIENGQVKLCEELLGGLRRTMIKGGWDVLGNKRLAGTLTSREVALLFVESVWCKREALSVIRSEWKKDLMALFRCQA